MAAYSYSTKGIFPVLTRALSSDGLGSFSYTFNPSIVELYNELNYGFLEFDSTPISTTETTTIDVDSLNATLSNTFLTDAGTGTGATGGFDIGRHIRFNSTTAPRTVEFSLPNDINSSLTFEVIRGNDTNGGEDPDTTTESLNLEYYNGSSWTSIATVVAYNDSTFDTLKSVEITIPSVARTAGTSFRLIQSAHSGNDWDHYGLKSVSYTYTTTYTPSIPTLDYGNITDENYTLVDHGRIIYVTIVEPFGFVKVVNGASWKATNSYEGLGIAFTFSSRTNAALYAELIDGKIKLSGSSHTVFSPTPVVGGNTFLGDSAQIGFALGFSGSGTLFNLTNTEESKTYDYVSSSVRISIEGTLQEEYVRSYEGIGNLFQFNNARILSTNSYVGSGVITLRSDNKERIAESYVPSDCNYFYDYDYGFIDYTGCTNSETVTGSLSGSSTACEIKVELGTTASISQQYQVALGLNEPSTIVDLGQITISASPQHDYGHIHVSSDECPFGLFRIDRNVGAADKFLPTWTSRGSIGKITGEARLPLFASVTSTGTIGKISGVSITNFSLLQPGDGLFDFVGSSDVVITQGYIGSGFIPTLSGAAESVSFNPDEAQLLFSSNGEARIASTSNWIGSGVLFTFESGTEKVVYEWIGSGRLFGFSSKEESRVYTYNCESIVEFETPDYGYIERCLSSEIISGDISGDTSACTSKVEEGTTARVVLGSSYKIELNSDIATDFVDYGYVRDAANALIDYGNILDSARQGLPGCVYGLFDITGSAASKLQPTYIAEGYIGKLTGEATVPLDVSIPVFGTIGTLRGESVPNFSLLHPGDGQIKVQGTLINFNFTLGFPGSGTIPKLGGASEVVAFNPDEKQMLFSFTGERKDSLAKAWEGSGNLFTIQTAVERRVYDYVGSGRLFGFNNTEERRVYSYNCSSIVEFETPDYGFVESCSVLESISGIVSGQALGCTSRVDLGSTASIDGSYQINLPDHIASEFLDYGSIVDLHNAALDYGHIFDTPREGLPGCIYGTIEIRGAAVDTFDPANVGQGTIYLDGTVFLNFTLSHIGSGSFRKLSGAAESIAIAEESTDLFDLNGSGHVVISLGYIGVGNLSTIGGAAEVVAFNPPEDVPTIKLRGTSGDPGILLAHTAEGTLFTINGGDIRVQHSYFGSGRLFGFNSKEEARTYVYDGGICVDEPDYDYGFLQGECLTIETIQGTVTGTTASCIAKVAPGTTASVDGTYRIETNDGTATEFYDYDLTSEPPDGFYDYGHILAETGVLCPAYLFKIRRGALTDYQTFDWQVSWVSSGTIRVSGVSQNQKVPRYNGDGQIFAINGAAESLTVNPVERDFLFSFTGTLTESFTPAPEIGSGNLFTFNNLVERISNDYVGTGTFVLSGESTNRYTPNHNGSGSFRKLSGAAESLTVNPVERQMLFSFTGELKEAFIANPPEEGTEIKISGEIPTPLLTFAEQPEVQISVFGTAIQRYTPNVIGSGSFRKLSGAAESLTVNPEEKQLLFSFTGGITSEKHTEVYVGVDTPIRIRRGALSDFETFDWQPSWVSQGTVKVTGDVTDKWVPNNVGSGSIFAISGSAESFTVNPDERQMLFSFTGTRSNESTTTVSQIEGGSLFNIGGAVESYAAAPKGDGLYRISGEGFITASLLHVGSGTFRKFSGAAESFTVNPDEKQLLFSFTGTLVESFGVAETKQIEVDIDGIGSFARSFAHSGIGSIRITGDSTNRFVVNNIGFGNIFSIGGSAEAVTFNPDEKQMLFSFTGERISEKRTSREVSQGGTISITGTSGDPLLTFAEQPEVQIAVSGESHTTRSRDHVGSGSLFAFSGSAEAFRAVPPTDKALFKFTGNSVNKFTADYVGSGSFRKLSGAAEAVTFNPDEKQMLFSFVGAGTEKTTAREVSQGGLFKASGEAGVLVRFAHTGEGTISVTGDTKFTRARDFVGSGFIPVLSGAAESLTFNPDEKQMLFSFVGTRDSEKITARELGTPGEFTLQGTSGDPLLTFAEKSFGNVVVSGISTVVRTQAFAGSGRLFGFANGDEAYGRAPYVTSGTINVSGNALVRVEVFQPPRTYVWII